MNTSLHDTLLKVGLEPTVIEVYLILIENGEMMVPQILAKTTLSRATVYDALPLLLAKDFIEYRKEGRVAYYKPAHPNKLLTLLEEKKREVALLEGEMKETVRSLTGTFNLALHKPGVRFYEGIEGIKEVLWDSLQTTGEIFTMGDLETFVKHSKPIHDEYLAERKKRNIAKKAIMVDSPFNREFLANYDFQLTAIRLMTDSLPIMFSSTIITIYNDRVSFVTFSNDSMVGLIVQEKFIHDCQKSIFDYLWNKSQPFRVQRATGSPPLVTA